MFSIAIDPATQLRPRIFEAIDALRQRKCRPDRESIAHYILRKYGVKFLEVFNELEAVVDEELLIKVEFKGSISYRLPSQFDTRSSPLLTKHSKILNSIKTTRHIITAINELLNLNASYNKTGIPFNELKSHLQSSNGDRFDGLKASIAIERELFSKSGNLFRSGRGKLFPKDIPIPSEEEEDKMAAAGEGDETNGKSHEKIAHTPVTGRKSKPISASPSPSTAKPEAPKGKKRGRKPKNYVSELEDKKPTLNVNVKLEDGDPADFDVEDDVAVEVPAANSGKSDEDESEVSYESEKEIETPKRTPKKRGRKRKIDLVESKIENAAASTISTISSTTTHSAKKQGRRGRSRGQTEACQKCSKEVATTEISNGLCTICAAVASKNPTKSLNQPQKPAQATPSSSSKTVTGPERRNKKKSNVTGTTNDNDSSDEIQQQLARNPSSWSSSEVETYFQKKGLREEGAILKEQEIDGLSLLLMSRKDILRGLPKLLLGPALKVHRLITELQFYKPDSRN